MKDKEYIVYRHVCPNGKIYIGVTCNVVGRWKPSCYKHSKLFYDIIIECGWKSIKHEVLYSGLTRDEALKIEGELITNGWDNGTCLNQLRSGHYQQTEEFKKECSARSTAWNKAHPERRKANEKAYRDSHRDEINARNRERRKRNKE